MSQITQHHEKALSGRQKRLHSNELLVSHVFSQTFWKHPWRVSREAPKANLTLPKQKMQSY